MKKVLLMYMPVVHVGYQNLIWKLNPSRILIISDEVANQFDKRRKDIRALSSSDVLRALKSLHPDIESEIFHGSNIPKEDEEIYMPVEDISEVVLSTFLSGRKIIWESVFLRYDSKKSMAPEEVIPDRIVSRNDPVISAIISQLYAEASKSPDWWRQISSAVVKDGKVLSLCHNRHSPSDVVTYALGDPRSNFTKGMNTNIGKPAHAEPAACFLAGKENCKGADLFATTFPCPQCANFIALYSGVKSLYFVEGYAMIDGADDLRSAGIEIVKVSD